MDEEDNDILRLLQVKDEPTILEEEDEALFLRAKLQVNKVDDAKAKERRYQRKTLNLLERLLMEQQLDNSMEIRNSDGGTDQPVLEERPLLHSKFRLTSQEKHELISQGIELRTGRFKLDEDKLIVKNLINFMKKYHISDVDSLLNSNAVYRNFRKEHNLYQCLGKGLNQRTLCSIFARAKSLIKHPEKMAASFNIVTESVQTVYNNSRANSSPVESIKGNLRHLLCERKSKSKSKMSSKSKPKISSKSKKIPEALTDISNKSIAAAVIEKNSASKNVARKRTISNKLQREKSLKTKLVKQKKQRNNYWNKDDEDILVNVMMNMIGRKRMLIPLFDFSWKDIAKKVPCKSAAQCKTHWIKSLYWSWESRETLKWSEENCAFFIFVMHKEMVQKEDLIDWDIIFDYFKFIVPSFGRVKIFWDDLKCLVPNYVEKDHEEIVLYLFYNILPEFLRKCNLNISDLQDKFDSLCS